MAVGLSPYEISMSLLCMFAKRNLLSSLILSNFLPSQASADFQRRRAWGLVFFLHSVSFCHRGEVILFDLHTIFIKLKSEFVHSLCCTFIPLPLCCLSSSSDVGRFAGLCASQVGWLRQMRHVLLPDFTDRLPAGLDAPDGGLDLAPAEMIELSQIEHHANAAHGKHEDQENRFFCGPGHVALHLLETRVAVALENPRHAEAIKEVLAR